ncbi:hypothetical protein ACQ4PT_025380 [Festuca glaucescens]
MATWVPSRGRANDPIIADAGTTAPACLSSRSVTATALDHADGARFGVRSVLMDQGDGIPAWRSGRLELHQPGRFSKAEHSTETSSAPTSSHGARFDVRSVLMDQGDGNPAWRSGCFDLHEPDPFFEGKHPTKTSASPTRFDTHSVVIHMDHAERVDSRGGGCLRDCGGLGVFKAEHPTEKSVSRTSSHAAGFDIRPVHQNHAVFSKAEHPIETSSTPASSHVVRFDVRSVLMNHGDGIPPRRSGCFDVNEPARFFRDDEHPTETSYRLGTHSVVMDMDHAERVDSQRESTLQHRGGLRVFKAQHATENSASQTSSHAAGFHIRSFHLLSVGRFKAGLLLMFILIASIAGTASSRPLHNSPPICPVGHQAASLHSRGHEIAGETGETSGNPESELPLIYPFFGIIDILQDYDISKKLEHAYKSQLYDPNSISAIDPKKCGPGTPSTGISLKM